jgi:hypothetical protein
VHLAARLLRGELEDFCEPLLQVFEALAPLFFFAFWGEGLSPDWMGRGGWRLCPFFFSFSFSLSLARQRGNAVRAKLGGANAPAFSGERGVSPMGGGLGFAS